jgi:23S rRNA (adenine2503-C2)-methyltransferase
MDLTKLEVILQNEPAFRLRQARQAVFGSCVDTWMEVKGLPLPIRETLERECPLAIDAEPITSETSDSIKTLITMSGGARIEAVLMKHNDGRNTVCVSSQVGCPMGCAFCATGKMGLIRNLSAFEIIEQVLFFARYLKQRDERVSGVVFMGMGEPLLNFDAVMDAVHILNDPDGFHIGARKISISTCGIVDGIQKLADEDIDVNLAISLHAPTDELRKKLMPVAESTSLSELFSAIDKYVQKKKRKVMFEYLMLDGVNDADEQAQQLVTLLKGKLCMINLIAYNDTGIFKPSSNSRIQTFKKILERGGIDTTVRHRFGDDIKGACGQLATEG